MKKIIYYLASIAIVILVSIILAEIILQVIPIIYRTLPNLKNDKQYIYILGESSAWGDPYGSKISYSKILKYVIGNRINNKQIELILLAEPGCKLSHQYFKYYLYKYIHPFKRGIVLLYIGTNDWANRNENHVLNCNLNIVSLFYYYLKKDKNIFNFIHGYERILLLSKKFGDDIYMSTIAGNYSGYVPTECISLEKNMIFKNNINKIDKLILSKDYHIAMKKCKELLNENNDQSQIWYRIGKIYEKQNNNYYAMQSYLNAIEYGRDSRPTRYQNEVIKKLAQKYNIPITDTFDKLNNSGEIIGYNFFMDIVHPSIRTNIIIAEGFIELLMNNYKIKIFHKDLTEDKIKKILHFNDRDVFDMYMLVLTEMFSWGSYINVNEIAMRYKIDIIEKHIQNLKLLDAYNKNIAGLFIEICELFTEYIKGNLNEKNKKILKNKIDMFIKYCPKNITYYESFSNLQKIKYIVN